MKTAAIILVTLGVAALIYGGFSFDREHTVVDMGPIKATVTEHRTPEISPIVGVIAIVGGLLLLVVPNRRLA